MNVSDNKERTIFIGHVQFGPSHSGGREEMCCASCNHTHLQCKMLVQCTAHIHMYTYTANTHTCTHTNSLKSDSHSHTNTYTYMHVHTCSHNYTHIHACAYMLTSIDNTHMHGTLPPDILMKSCWSFRWQCRKVTSLSSGS